MRSARKCREVMYPPERLIFKPAGVPANELETVNLSVDEYEAIRLADYERLDHQEASERMGISRSTFTRLVCKARQKVSVFLIDCCSLEIKGGNFHFNNDIYVCNNCGNKIDKKVGKQPLKCPDCGSEDLSSLAEELGHGDCCYEYNERKRKIKNEEK